MNYYNENDPRAAAWLRELVRAGELPPGDVDERSITDVRPTELVRYAQCHFFAGLGGWSRALRIAQWPDARPVWTGSCPCQPFSVAGKGKGAADERHLWPVFGRLIAACKPAIVFGEQVASPAGRGWLAGVSADLEGMGYHFGAADLCAAGVGAPHIRQRLYWVADSNRARLQRAGPPQPEEWHSDSIIAGRGEAGGAGHAQKPGLEGHARHEHHGHEPGRLGAHAAGPTAPAGDAGFWHGAIGHRCTDGTTRRIPVEPGLFPLADGLPAHVGLLRGAGNAIVPQLAAQFILAATEAVNLLSP